MQKLVSEDIERFWSKVSIKGDDECWPWTGFPNRDGYGTFTIRGEKLGAHVVALMLKLGRPVRKGFQACHTCDECSCCNSRHLFEGTNGDNVADRNNKQRQARGEKIGQARLTEASVKVIRELYASGQYSQHRLATLYGVGVTVINNVVNRKTWKHVE